MLKNKLLTGLLLVSFSAPLLKAQDDITDLLKAGISDAEILGEAYLKPYGDMMGRSLNGGWYNVASVHSPGGFNINIGINMSMVSSAGKTFDVNECISRMSDGWRLRNPSNHIAPTIAGSMETQRPELRYNKDGDNIEFELPDGTGLGIMPLPMIQVGIGLPLYTEIMGKFMPAINLSEYGKIGSWGIGLKHSFKEYVPFLKDVPHLQTSVLAGYSHMGIKMYLDDYAETDGDHELQLNSSGFIGRLLVGAEFPVISFYMGLGYGNTSSKFGLVGKYEVDDDILEDPITLNFKNNSFDANIGMRIKLGIFTLYGDYTIGDYPMVSAGFGFTVK